MLFDLRARGRRTTIKVIYVFLALLMGGGLIFFGIGGATNGGLLDAFKGGNGGTSAQKLAPTKGGKAEKNGKLRPAHAAASGPPTQAQYPHGRLEQGATSGQD